MNPARIIRRPCDACAGRSRSTWLVCPACLDGTVTEHEPEPTTKPETRRRRTGEPR
jgi:hypothetical protein